MRKLFLATLAASAMLCSAAQAAIAVSESGGVTAGAYAHIGYFGAPTTPQNQDSFTGAPKLMTEVAEALEVEGAEFVYARTQVAASWSSPDAGAVQIHLSGDADVTTLPSSHGHRVQPDIENWFYQFSAAENGVFNMDYEVAHSEEDPFGLGNFRILINGVPIVDLFRADVTGTLTYALAAGNDYRVSIENYSYVSPAVEGPTTTTGLFAFKILGAAAVPEPAAWALMIAGFGLVGASLRRRGTVAGLV